jgi:hypothetical protein
MHGPGRLSAHAGWGGKISHKGHGSLGTTAILLVNMVSVDRQKKIMVIVENCI